MGLEEGSVNSKVGGGARQGLHIYTPLLRAQTKEVQGTSFTEKLALVNELVTTIVPASQQTPRFEIKDPTNMCTAS